LPVQVFDTHPVEFSLIPHSGVTHQDDNIAEKVTSSWSLPLQLKPNAVEYEEHKPHSVGRKILGMPLFVGSWASGRRLSFVASIPTGGRFMLIRFTKTQKKRNGAGTFGFLVTLKKYEQYEKRPEGLRGLSWRTDYD
jgi:hypothetical protein